MDNRTFELVTANPGTKWAWYELAKRNVPLYCSLRLCEYLKANEITVLAGYDEYKASINR